MLQNYDQVLEYTINILNKNKVKYWLSDGTLLGIIRENRLLPWDDDLDFAVFSHNTNKNYVVKLFIENNFEYIEELADMDCLHFEIDGFRVDIGFYRKIDSYAQIKWAKYSENILKKYFVLIVNILFKIDKIKYKYLMKQSILKRSIVSILYIVKIILPRRILNLLYNFAKRYYQDVKMQLPIELLKFKELKYKNLEVTVPCDSDKYLEIAYGKNWRIPIKNYTSDRFK